jgi:hypothetical protein
LELAGSGKPVGLVRKGVHDHFCQRGAGPFQDRPPLLIVYVIGNCPTKLGLKVKICGDLCDP